MDNIQVQKNRDGIYIPAEVVSKVRKNDHDAFLISEVDGKLAITTRNSEKSDHHRKIRPDGRIVLANCWLGDKAKYSISVEKNRIFVR